MPSLRVADLVRGIVAERKPVTARTVALRVGACKFLVGSVLDALAAEGLLVRRECRPTHKNSRPFHVYLPEGARCRRPTPSSRGTPAPSPSPTDPPTA